MCGSLLRLLSIDVYTSLCLSLSLPVGASLASSTRGERERRIREGTLLSFSLFLPLESYLFPFPLLRWVSAAVLSKKAFEKGSLHKRTHGAGSGVNA